MRSTANLSYRRDTDAFCFRWYVPTSLQPLLGGKREIRHTLPTTDKRIALRLAKRLAKALDGAALMARQPDGSTPSATFYLTLARMVDGTLKIEMDPDKADEEVKLLNAAVAALNGLKPATNETHPSGKPLAQVVKDYFEQGERVEQWTPKTQGEIGASLTLLCEVLGPKTPIDSLKRTARGGLAHIRAA